MSQVRPFILPINGRAKALQLASTVLAGLGEGTAWKVTIEPVKSTRTLSQNAYLWGVLYPPIVELTGYETEELHEYCLGSFYGWIEKKVPRKPSAPTGFESVPRRTTTTDETGKRAVLSTREFADYVDFVQRFAAEKLGLVLPDPDPRLVRRA